MFIYFKGLGARPGGAGQKLKIFMIRQKGGSSNKKLEDVRQKCSSPDEGDIIHQPILPIPPHCVKMYRNILSEEKLLTSKFLSTF